MTLIAIGSHLIVRPVLLAPMAGVTDAPFRRLARRLGAPFTVSEMVACRELLHGRANVRAKAAADAEPEAVQLAGRDPLALAEAARMAEAGGAAVIDINMGCPAKKVTGGLAGSALMREPALAIRLVEALVAAVKVPVTVKMRLGWDEDSRNAPELARRAVESGAAMIAVHGRTRRQFYSGAADWAAVGAVVAVVRAPVIVNGDIADAASAREALRLSGAAGVMIGRAAQVRPWLPAQIAAALSGEAYAPPDLAEQGALLARHYAEMIDHYGAEIGMRAARKHLGWRLAPLPDGPALRARLVRIDDPDAVLRLLEAYFGALAAEPVRSAA